MRKHLVNQHREQSVYLTDPEVDRHYTGQRHRSRDYSDPPRHRGEGVHESRSNIHMNTTEFSDVLSNMTTLISTNIQQGIGSTLNAAAYFNNMKMNSRCNYPMYQPATMSNQYPSTESSKIYIHREMATRNI